MKKHSYIADIFLVTGLLALIAAPSFAVPMPNLGAAAGYTVLDSLTPNAQAKADAQNVYNQILAMACSTNMTDQSLNNQRLGAGVYCFDTPTFFQGQVIFDAKGDSNAIFVMKIASRFDAWPDSSVLLVGGAQPQNVFWLAGGAVTIGTSANFVGTVITMAPISFGRGGDASVFDEHGMVNGRLWSVGNTVTIPARGVTVGFIAPLVNPFIPQPPQPQAVQPTGALLSVIVNEPGVIPFVNGMRVVSGMKNSLPAGTYTITEVNTSAVDYGAPAFSVGCAQNGLTGVITLNAGDDKVCVINNNVNLPVYGGKIAVVPSMPNTGFGEPTTAPTLQYLPLLNMIGLLLIGAFVWQETVYGKRLA